MDRYQQPSNANTPWSNEHDQSLLENIHLSDYELANALGRTVVAIQCRRAHHAAKLHQADSGSTVEHCSQHMRVNPSQTYEVLANWKSKEAAYKNFMHKRPRTDEAAHGDSFGKAPAQGDSSGKAPVQGDLLGKTPAQGDSLGKTPAPALAPPDVQVNLDDIKAVCDEITRDDGKLGGVFEDDDLRPVLIMYYPGFQAYAMHIRGI